MARTHSGAYYPYVAAAEKVLGRRLKWPEEVHHLDGNEENDANHNLVICPDRAYHKLLHVRLRAYQACGNGDYRKCVLCGAYDDQKNLANKDKSRPSGKFVHRSCDSAWHKKRYVSGKS